MKPTTRAANQLADKRDPASYRDPSGHIFRRDGVVYRQINPSYFEAFARLSESGLYDALQEKGWLVPHELTEENEHRKVIRPRQLDFINYPYEWSFSQLKEAALLTLAIHDLALDHGMVLKDATAFNTVFDRGRMVFIDTLSFDLYKKDDPWVAYGQFCRHFLAPLLLIKHRAPDLNRLQVLFLDGVPLELASQMLPVRTHFSPFVKTNIHMHASSLRRHQHDTRKAVAPSRKPKLSLRMQKHMLQSMTTYIESLTSSAETEWGNYYDIKNYEKESFEFKEKKVKSWINEYKLKDIWDVGGNNGHFSRLIQEECKSILCTDIDPVAVDQNYLAVKTNQDHKIIPLVIDLTNASPGIGFDNVERADFLSRVTSRKLDCILALALIHHLSISNNCTFEMLAKSFSNRADKLIIEFIDPEDSWARSLLESKRDAKDLFAFYTRGNFEAVFSEYFEIIETAPVPGSRRVLYLMASRRPGADRESR